MHNEARVIDEPHAHALALRYSTHRARVLDGQRWRWNWRGSQNAPASTNRAQSIRAETQVHCPLNHNMHHDLWPLRAKRNVCIVGVLVSFCLDVCVCDSTRIHRVNYNCAE